jgi:dipeptidyl aminopeptidase/acylaminoacyl peptidase
MSEAKKRLITAEDLYRFELISDVRLSPDGKNVVYVQKRVDRKTEKKYGNLWVIPTQGGKPRQFTFGDQKDISPHWSPDGKTIAFLSNRADQDKAPQIYLISFGGGEAHKISEIPGEITSISWSPDDRKILCSVRKLDPDELERQNNEQKKKLGVVNRRYDRFFYKFDGFGYLPHEREHIWTVDVHSGTGKQLTDHKIYDEKEPAYSPDGKWIAFLSNHSEDPDRDFERVDLFVIPSRGGAQKKIETSVGDKVKLSFSPDGKWIAFVGQEGEHQDYKNYGLWVVPIDGSVPARNLTAAYDLNVSPSTINDMGEPEFVSPTWSNDGKIIYFQCARHGATQLLAISVDGKRLDAIIEQKSVVCSFSFDKKQSILAYQLGRIDDPCQIIVREMLTAKEKQLTSLNRSILSKVNLSKVEEVWFKSPSGMDLQGWVLTPPGFDPKKKYPSILEIHGGPQTQYGFFFMHEFYYLASKGYVVYFCNPRGGRGYGEEHTKAIWRDWGTNDYADLMAWVDQMEKAPFIDRSRMGVTGGSYGGYMTVWIIGHTQRFQAAVTQRCVSNFVSMWGSSDLNHAFEDTVNRKPPYEDLQNYWDHSPIAYIGNARTPTLVVHNENDMRCPIEQGEQVYVALKKQGVPTEMVRFPDEFHGLSRSGRTDRRIVRLNSILGWFEKYLK